MEFFHSVRLNEDKCKGCINCIKRCPTEAIRVRNGKARISPELCIDCGVCIRICPHHAKTAYRDKLDKLKDFKYNIALPAPALYGQFNNLDDIDYILTAFKKIGFDDVFEVAVGAEIVSEATRKWLKENPDRKTVISSACPAVLRLIRVRYPKLIPNVLPLNAPIDEAARLAREKAKKETGLNDEDIGVFFISPCPAKITAIKQPICTDKKYINGALSMKDIYPLLLKNMTRETEPENIKNSGVIGVSWASSGGEAASILKDNCLAADGIENVIQILGEIENEKLPDLSFVELLACPGGCIGGPLTVENPFVAKSRLQRLRKYLPVACNHLESDTVPDSIKWDSPLTPTESLKLASNVSDAMQIMAEIYKTEQNLPGLDCGICGAPSCSAMAKDIALGKASLSDCIFHMKKKIKSKKADEKLVPAPFRTNNKDI